MDDAAEPIAKPFRLHIAAAVIVAGFLWFADGRLWPSIAAHARDTFWLVMLLQLVFGSWLLKSRPGRVVAVFLYGAFFWLGAEGVCSRVAEGGSERSSVVAGGALVLAVIAASVAWDWSPVPWRARMVASPIVRGVGICLLFVMTIGFLWVLFGAVAEGGGPWARVRLTALFLALAGGLVLALWRLDGWGRDFACWAIASLTWALLMTGLASSGSLAEIGVGGWLLAAVPPLIGGVILTAYWRINRTYGV
jgi:hypothetical protein